MHEIDPSGEAGKPRLKKGNCNNNRGQDQYERGRKRERTPERDERYSTSRSAPTGFHLTGPDDMKTPSGMTRDKPLNQSTSPSSISNSP